MRSMLGNALVQGMTINAAQKQALKFDGFSETRQLPGAAVGTRAATRYH